MNTMHTYNFNIIYLYLDNNISYTFIYNKAYILVGRKIKMKNSLLLLAQKIINTV